MAAAAVQPSDATVGADLLVATAPPAETADSADGAPAAEATTELPESKPAADLGPAFALVYPPFWVGRGPHPKLLVQLLGACVMLFIFCFLYVGAAWNPQPHLHSLEVAVLSCDAGVPLSLQPLLPPALSAAPPLGAQLVAGTLFDAASPAAGLLGWRGFTCGAAAGGACGAASADACRAELVRAVERGEAWSALFVPAGFTAAVLSNAPALRLNASTARVEHIYGSGRSLSTYTYVRSYVSAAVGGISGALARAALSDATLSATLSKSFFVTPLALVATDLHPVVHFGQHFATYVLCVLLWMGSAFTTALIYQYKTAAETDALRNTRPIPAAEALRTLLSKSGVAVAFSFLQAVSLVAVILCIGRYSEARGGNADGCQFAHNPGVAIAYGAYMAWSFLSINALSLHVFGQERFTAITTLLLIVQLTSAGAFFSEQLSNQFFRVGRGLPFYYGVRAFRTIFFGGQENWMPINWMVPTVWNAGCWGIYAAFTVARLQRRVLAGAQPIQALTPLTGVVLA